MHARRAYFGLAFSLLVVAVGVMSAKRLDAGPERFTIACTCPSGPQSGSVVIPITITMNSDGPDYIDLTYTAVDGGGNPVSCAPAGNRLYVAKGSPANDNVTVTYSTSGTVNFEATGQGEVYGYDVDGCSCNGIVFGARIMKASKPAGKGAPKSAPNAAKGKKPARNVKAATYAPVAIPASPDTPYSVWVVPIAMQLTSGPNDNVTATYLAQDQNGNKLQCVPNSDSFTLQSGVTPANLPAAFNLPGILIRHVAVRSTAAISSLNFTLTGRGLAALGGTPNTGTWTFSTIATGSSLAPVTPANASGSGSGNLSAGYLPIHKLKEHIIEVDVAPAAGDLVTIRFSAIDAGGQEFRCRPQSVRVAATKPVYVVVNCDASDSSSGIAAPIQFLAHSHSEKNGDLADVPYPIASP